MTRRDFTRLLIKTFGLILICNAMAALPLIINAVAIQSSVATSRAAAVFIFIQNFGPFIVHIALGLSFLIWSGRIIDKANTAERPNIRQNPTDSIRLKDMEISLVAVIGLYFLADGFAEFCRVGLRLVLDSLLDGFGWRFLFLSFNIGFTLEALLKMTIGTSLILGRGKTVALLRGARIWVHHMRKWRPTVGLDELNSTDQSAHPADRA